MNILLFLIPMSLLLIGIAAWIFSWAVRHGQFEDMDTPALDILREDATIHPAETPAELPTPAADSTPRNDAG